MIAWRGVIQSRMQHAYYLTGDADLMSSIFDQHKEMASSAADMKIKLTFMSLSIYWGEKVFVDAVLLSIH